MPKSIEQLRRDAKALKSAYESGDAHARHLISACLPTDSVEKLKHADYLHVIAREHNFASWPTLKLSVDLLGMDRAQKLQRLKSAVHHGQCHVIEQLLSDLPDLPDGSLEVEIALYRHAAVATAIHKNPALAVQDIESSSPLIHLARSRMLEFWPKRKNDMLAIARLLLANGADLNRGVPAFAGSDHRLSPLYFAIGHANNMVLGQWLLEHGANPDDNESLYHATELGHHEGLRLLLSHGADPRGTNALLRAIDFNDIKAVQMLLAAGASVDEFDETPVGGDRPVVTPALHQAARRMGSTPMIELLLAAGADPARTFEGCTVYGYAKVFGNRALAQALEEHSPVPDLTTEEKLLSKLADGETVSGQFINAERLPEAYRNLLRTLLHLPEKVDHVQRLVAHGIEYDRPDAEGLTPVQVAGWEGLPDMMAYLLDLKPDLSHVNGYGGTLLSTIIHGSENCPTRTERDHIACLKLALTEGVALPRRAAELASNEAVAEFLIEWAKDHPGQVVDRGIV